MRHPLPNPTRARIVFDERNPDKDKFVALRFAEKLCRDGDLYPLDLPGYPQSYAAPRNLRS